MNTCNPQIIAIPFDSPIAVTSRSLAFNYNTRIELADMIQKHMYIHENIKGSNMKL